MMDNKKYLFLDDIRMPATVGNYMLPVELRSKYRVNNWNIVRNYEQFVKYIKDNGVPDVISFDHDLADCHYDPESWRESFEYMEETGFDCAKWLCEYLDGEPLPICWVHSMNVVGKTNILSYLENYQKSIKI